ncbi:hypothetical protein Tco_1007361, partial [Tanacetum coccineum]
MAFPPLSIREVVDSLGLKDPFIRNLIDLLYFLLAGVKSNGVLSAEMNTMAEQNVPAQPPTRTDEKIFWKTMSYNEKTGVYSCQVDEQWFDLSADLLRKSLAITPVNPADFRVFLAK